jgi:hypothetical protein
VINHDVGGLVVKDVVRNNFPISEQNAVLPNGFFEEAGRVHKIQG